MQNVVVIFQAKQQETESLALSLGLGAVQRGANIRLRHLDPSPDFKMAHAGYGTLTPEDLRWAEGVAVALENELPEDLALLEASILAISADANSANKWSFVYAERPDSGALLAVRAMLLAAGFQELAPEAEVSSSPLEYMKHVGKRLADIRVG